MTHTPRSQVEKIAAQIGSSLDDNNAQWINRFMVKSTSSSSVYRVAQRRSDGSWGCDCWGWKRHRKCKHLTDILARLVKVEFEAKMELDAATLAMLASARTAFLDLGGSVPVAHRASTGRQIDL